MEDPKSMYTGEETQEKRNPEAEKNATYVFSFFHEQWMSYGVLSDAEKVHFNQRPGDFRSFPSRDAYIAYRNSADLYSHEQRAYVRYHELSPREQALYEIRPDQFHPFPCTVYIRRKLSLAEQEKNARSVWSEKLKRCVPYGKLSRDEKARYDREQERLYLEKYPYDGLTYEEWCGSHS